MFIRTFIAVTLGFWAGFFTAQQQAKADEGRDMMRCVAHAFAANMGPYTDAKATPSNTATGLAMHAALQTCDLEWLLREQPAVARHVSDNAIIYWAMKD